MNKMMMKSFGPSSKVAKEMTSKVSSDDDTKNKKKKNLFGKK